VSRWLAWQPTEKSGAFTKGGPSKPTKPGFDGFEGSIVGCSASFSEGEVAGKPTSRTACGSADCAGCYSVGTIDGRERFIHPPKASEEWQEWFRKWQPKVKRTQ
jgi:hypothetical protein